MPDDGSTQSTTVWPLPKFYFSVQFGTLGSAAFQEVRGLESETQVIEYRHGNSPIFAPIKMPGIAKTGNVTMKKGVFPAAHAVWNWFESITTNSISRQTVIVSLLDEEGAATMVWTLHNAWPTKLTGTDLKSDGTEVAVETIEIAFETMTVATS